jgi:hypothetical protein
MLNSIGSIPLQIIDPPIHVQNGDGVQDPVQGSSRWKQVAIVASSLVAAVLIAMTNGLPEAVLTTAMITVMSTTGIVILAMLARLFKKGV